MKKNEQEVVMTGVDEHGRQIFQPKNSFYAEDYWQEVVNGSVLLPEEQEENQEAIELTPDELEVYYSVLNNNNVVLEEGSNE